MALDYELIGDDMQAVVITLTPGQLLRAEAGALMYMTDSVTMDTTLGGKPDAGLMGGLMSGLKRVITGESLFITMFQAQGQPGTAAFSAPYPGKIIPLNLDQLGTMLCQRDSFLCAEADTDISIAFTRRLGAGFFGGEGFILQKLVGHGTAFVHSGGTIVSKELAPGETLRVDTGCLVAMQESITYDIQMVKGVKTMLFGGEGLFFATLTGPGRVFLQTLPFSRLANRILALAPQASSSEESTGVAGIGGSLLRNIVSGD